MARRKLYGFEVKVVVSRGFEVPTMIWVVSTTVKWSELWWGMTSNLYPVNLVNCNRQISYDL